MAERDHLIFFDQDCGFCRRMLRIVYQRDQKHERRLFPIALQDRAAERELSGLTEAERMASWHLKTPSGEIASGGAAIAPLFELLRLPDSWAAFLHNHPRLAEKGYDWVAARRSAFGSLTRPLPEFERR